MGHRLSQRKIRGSGQMIRILFVDDEQNILNGLRRMLRGQRDVWDMCFANSGEEALRMVNESEFDIVVTDMRMPGMDGAEVLSALQADHPEIVRIILSGHSSLIMALKSVKAAHQYLNKPCDTEELLTTLTQAADLRRLLTNENVKRLVSSVESLPSIPELYNRIIVESSKKEASLQRIGEIISEDVGMTTMILKMVNSAFFGLFREITNATQAVNMLGLDIVEGLVLSAHLFQSFDRTSVPAFSLNRFMDHSLLSYRFAQAIAKEENMSKKGQDLCATTAMLHDMGMLVLCRVMGEQYNKIVKSNPSATELLAAEVASIGATHSEVGAYLMGLWGFPQEIIHALAYHHTPSQANDKGFMPLTAAHAANAFANALVKGTEPELDMAYISSLGLTSHIPTWKGLCSDIYEKSQEVRP